MFCVTTTMGGDGEIKLLLHAVLRLLVEIIKIILILVRITFMILVLTDYHTYDALTIKIFAVCCMILSCIKLSCRWLGWNLKKQTITNCVNRNIEGNIVMGNTGSVTIVQ